MAIRIPVEDSAPLYSTIRRILMGADVDGTPDVTDTDDDNDGLDDLVEDSLQTDPLDPDTDGDDMPDGWEYNNGLDPKDAGDKYDDEDGDGWSNWHEYLAGTDPDDADSFPPTTRGGGGISCAAGTGAGPGPLLLWLAFLTAAGLGISLCGKGPRRE